LCFEFLSWADEKARACKMFFHCYRAHSVSSSGPVPLDRRTSLVTDNEIELRFRLGKRLFIK
jgi:hypothetical protein